MATLINIVNQAIIQLHREHFEEWIHLKQIYEKVEELRRKENANNGASIRAALETHCKSSDAFLGEELFLLKEKGTGLYKSINYDRIKFIDTMNIGDIFSREQLMNIFKISGQSGIMPSNTLNCIVITTSELNEIYEDSAIENGTIQYTGAGQDGDQKLSGPNKSLAISKENNKAVYLFSKDKQKRYIFEGVVELYDVPYKVLEKNRMVWKFPFKIMDNIENTEEQLIKQISYEIVEISNKIEIEEKPKKLAFKDEPLKIRKYKINEEKRKYERTSKPDYIAEEIIKSKQGEINEKDVYEYELNEMMKKDAKEQVSLMEEFFKNKKENEGYDILSFELNESGEYEEKYIEVKSTKGPESTPIDITVNEIEFAKNHIDNYYLYRIINSESNDRYVKIVTGKELFNNYKFVPVKYIIYSL